MSTVTLTGDDYRYRFEAEAKQRFIELLRERFNAGVTYKGRVLKWDTIIEQKANELGKFLTSRSSVIDFGEPSPVLDRQDSNELRSKILALTHSEAEQLGIRRSTLHYLRKRSRDPKQFTVYARIRNRLR